MNAGQAAEQQRVRRDQRLHVGDDSVHISADRGRVVGIDAAEDAARNVIKNDANLREIGVRRGRGGDAVGKRSGRNEESIRAILRRQPLQRGIVIDDIEDVEMAGAQRRFCGGDASKGSAAVHRSGGCRQRGRDVGQDGLDMGQRVAGKLLRSYLRLKAGLHGGEIIHVSEDAAATLAALLDNVLPQAANQRARRIVEGRAEIGKRGRRSGWRRRSIGSDRRIGRYRRHGGIRIRNRIMLMVLMVV